MVPDLDGFVLSGTRQLGGVTPSNLVHLRNSAATRRCALAGSASTWGLVGAMGPLLRLRRLGVVALGLAGLVGFFQAHLCVLGLGLLCSAPLRATSNKFCSSAHSHARCRARTWSGVSCASNSRWWGMNSCALMVPLFMRASPHQYSLGSMSTTCSP